MSVTIRDVEHIAALAHLSFTDEEKQKLTGELNVILEHMEQLNRLDTDGVEPLSHVMGLSNVFRADEVRPPASRADTLRNAPAKTDEYFKVPKVLGDR